MKIVKRLAWEVGCARRADEMPQKFIPATVPGAVQLDVMRAGELPDYRKGENFRLYEGLEDLYWTYRARLPEGENVFLVSGGIDYKYRVFSEDVTFYEYEGMQKPFEADVSAAAGKMIYIRIAPAPKAEGEEGRSKANRCCKGAVSYGWDFHPRLIPLGIWNDCYAELRTGAYVERADISYTLNDSLDRAEVTLAYSVKGGGVRFSLAGMTASGGEGEGVLKLTLDKPELWYPAGYGKQFLYDAVVQAVSDGRVCDEVRRRIGFRRVALGTTEYNWKFVQSPATQAYPPVYPEVNGVRVFAKGTNWVIPEIFYSEMTEEKYRRYVGLMRDANMNFVRCWGGCTANKEIFFDLCDEYGILVWQEFPLSCNRYGDDPQYLRTLASEAEAMLRRIGRHACCAMFVGGNELFMGWSGMTQQSKALRMLDALCLRECPDIPFLMTAPLMGMRHGGYGYDYAGEEPHLYVRGHEATAYTEFGVPSLSSYETILSFMDEQEAGKRGGAWEAHHGCLAWEAEAESWAYLPAVRSAAGEQGLKGLCEASRKLQAAYYQALFEEIRRHSDICGMALNWMFCDVWPSAANNSVVEYGGDPKPAYYAIARALKPCLFTFIFGSIFCGDTFRAAPYILSEGKECGARTVRAVFAQRDRSIVRDVAFPPQGKTGEWFEEDLSAFEDGFFTVSLLSEEGEADNEYIFVKKGAKK